MNRKQRRQQKKQRGPLPSSQAAVTPDPKKLQLLHQGLAAGAELCGLNKYEEAETLYKGLQQHIPQDPRPAYNLGVIAQRQGRLHDSRHWFEQALSVAPEFHKALYGLAMTLMDLGQTEDALVYGEKAIQAKPDDWECYACQATLLGNLGRLEEAVDVFHQALKYSPGNAGIYFDLSTVKKFTPDDPDILAMKALDRDADVGLPAHEQMLLNFALGKALMDCGEDETAFEKLAKANALMRRTLTYEKGVLENYFESIARLFDQDLVERFKNCGHSSSRPIFIVSMPRAGSTLVEQILSAHPDVYGAGELGYFQNCVPLFENPDLAKFFSAAESTCCPALLENLTPNMVQKIGAAYVEKIEALNGDVKHITDKMPFNFIWLGLIRLALPNAKIIHVRRDPVATCFSCYKQKFQRKQLWAYDLAEIGGVYKSYHQLMTHWTSLFGDSIYTLQYETLISNQEEETRQLLAYCQIPWDDSCLQFHRTDRQVKTASLAQVRSPIYKDSVSAWKNYEKCLGPLLDELGDLAH